MILFKVICCILLFCLGLFVTAVLVNADIRDMKDEEGTGKIITRLFLRVLGIAVTLAFFMAWIITDSPLFHL